ncbi:MAG TPA: hypothetical protein VFC28_12945, partial [Opitutaceae bacterium]|nr:hypothetical protein [Opitutaceae bacterium]
MLKPPPRFRLLDVLVMAGVLVFATCLCPSMRAAGTARAPERLLVVSAATEYSVPRSIVQGAIFEPATFRREHVIVFVAAMLAFALVLVLWALVRQRQLRHRIMRQAEELDESRRILAEAQEFASLGYWRNDFNQPALSLCSEENYRIFERDPQLGAPTLAEIINYAVAGDRERWREAIAGLQADGR